MRDAIESELGKSINAQLVAEMLDAHEEVKRNFYLGGLRLSAVEGGIFCEAAFRILEELTTGAFSPLGTQLDAERLINRLRGLAVGSFSSSIRLHIPRALRLVYDIRNNRDAAHLADGIDPNFQDATLIVSTVDWVLAEFLRMYHSIQADEVHTIVNSIVERKAPIVQEFDGVPRVLNPDLGPSDHCLVLVYCRGDSGATFEQLKEWVRPSMQTNLRRTLNALDRKKDLIHFDGSKYLITRLGIKDAEGRRLVE